MKIVTKNRPKNDELPKTSFYKESSIHALLISNEELKGELPSGGMPIQADGSKPTCLLFNKIAMKKLTVENQTKILNIRADALSVSLESRREIVKLLYTVPSKLKQPVVEQELRKLRGHNSGTQIHGVQTS